MGDIYCIFSLQVAPYVVSTLYSLLRNPDVFTMAKRMCLQETLTAIIENVSRGQLGKTHGGIGLIFTISVLTAKQD